MKTRIFCLHVLSLIATASAAQPGPTPEWRKLIETGELAEARQDYDLALYYYLKSAKLGTPAAMNAAAWVYLKYKNDPERAFLWCTAASHFGHAIDFGCLMTTKKRLTPQQQENLGHLATQCIATQYKSCDRLDASQGGKIKAYHDTKCVVADPTGTILNLRSAPNGKVISTAENGLSVVIVDTAKDARGQDWSYLKSDEGQMNLGWAFKAFLRCGAR